MAALVDWNEPEFWSGKVLNYIAVFKQELFSMNPYLKLEVCPKEWLNDNLTKGSSRDRNYFAISKY